MSDGIQGQAWDRQPFGHSWSSRRVGNAPGWDGPPDPSPEDEARAEKEADEQWMREQRARGNRRG